MTSSIVLTRPIATAPSGGDTSTSMINGQPTVTMADPTRVNKMLSIAEDNYVFSRNAVSDESWFYIGATAHRNSGYIMKFDGTVCFASAHCEDTGAASKDIHLFIDDDDKGIIGTINGGVNASFVNTTIDIDYVQGQKLRIRAFDTSGSQPLSIRDTAITITTKHRN